MATLENTVMIRRPIEEVFGFLADFENIPRWNYAIVETHKVSQGPIGVGKYTASPLGSEPERRALRGHRLQPARPAGDTRPTRAIPLPSLLRPGRHPRGNPGHQLSRARTPRP